MAKFAPHMGAPHGGPQTSPQHADPHGLGAFLGKHTRKPCGSACCGLVCGSPCRSPMWGKFRHGLLEEPVSNAESGLTRGCLRENQFCWTDFLMCSRYSKSHIASDLKSRSPNNREMRTPTDFTKSIFCAFPEEERTHFRKFEKPWLSKKLLPRRAFRQSSTLLENSSPIFQQHEMHPCQGLGAFRQGQWLLANRPRLRERSWIFSSPLRPPQPRGVQKYRRSKKPAILTLPFPKWPPPFLRLKCVLNVPGGGHF